MDGCSEIAPQGAQRTALHFEIAVASVPAHAPVQSLASIVKALAESSAKGDAMWSRGGAVFRIARVRFNKTSTRSILLLQHTGADIASVSAHLVIDLTPGGAGVYRAILEHAPEFAKARIEEAMQGLARKFSEFYFREPSGKFWPAHPRLSFTQLEGVSGFAVESELAMCEPEIRPDVSVKLDTLLRQRAAKRAA